MRTLNPESCSAPIDGWWAGAVRLVVARLCMAVLVSLFVASCRTEPEAASSGPVAADQDTVELDQATRDHLGIEVVVARESVVGEPVIAPAVVELDPRRVGRVGAPVEGRIREVLVQVGDRVAAGQTLAWLYSSAWEDALARARTAAAAERSARAERDYAEQQLARSLRLWAAQAAGRQEVDRARLEVVVARNKLRAARTELARARREVRQLSGDATIPVEPRGLPLRAPIVGTVLEREASPGQAVVPGTHLFTVAQLDRLWLVAEVDEIALGKLQAGMEVEFRVNAYPGERFSAVIDYIGDVLDPKTRRVKVRCDVENSSGRLRAGMFASLFVPIREPERLLTVPDTAVQELDSATVVFVPTAENRFQRRTVQVGRRGDGWVEIRSGLRPGDQVVGRGSFLLKSAIVLRAQPAED